MNKLRTEMDLGLKTSMLRMRMEEGPRTNELKVRIRMNKAPRMNELSTIGQRADSPQPIVVGYGRGVADATSSIAPDEPTQAADDHTYSCSCPKGQPVD